MSNEPLVYTIRPNGLSLWLPPDVLEAIGAKRGDRLTEDQFEREVVQRIVRDRTQFQKKK